MGWPLTVTRLTVQRAEDLGDEQILEQIMADPRQAASVAETAIGRARARRDSAAQASAQRALGLAAHVLHDAAAAATYLRQAIRCAQRAGETVIEAEARMSYALVLDDLGHPAAALREIDRACAQLSGLRLARATMQRALILRRVGRDIDALAGYRRALSAFRRHGDALWQGRALVNRGVLLGYHGELAQARADLEEAVQIFAQLNLATAVAQAQHNLGFLAAQAGDVRAALHYFDLAREQLSYIGAAAVTQLDRAELLLAARLLPEARVAAAEAIDAARAGQFTSLLGQAQLLSARIELISGAPADARTTAARARATFVRQGRPTWAVLARRIEVAARVAAGGRDRRAVRALEQAGDELAAASWLPRAWDAWIDAARLAVDLDDGPAAARCLDKAAAARSCGPAPLRARARHAAALIALRDGDLTAAKKHAVAGYRDIEAHQASLGATELGMRSGAAGVEIAALRLRLALRERDCSGALRWLQRVRSAALRLPAARPADDPEVAAHLAELRAVSNEIATTAIDSAPMQRLLRRQRAIEADVRQLSWRAAGAATAAPLRQPQLPELASALGDRALAELFALDGGLHALAMVDGRIYHRPLCAVSAAAGELSALRFAIRRRMVYAQDPAAAARAAAAVSYSAAQLELMLLAPLAGLIGDRPLVLAPTGALHGLPWAMLASCRGRPVAVSPSSWQWWQAARQPAGERRPVLIGAPVPQHAAAEVARLHALRPESLVLTGSEATVAGALAALDGAAAGHIACHGVFRADNPLFSQLMLSDGPMTMCDLSALRHPPGLLILSSCDAGLSAVHPGDELQGLAAALLGLGTRTVIAGLGPVEDEATLYLMTGLHERLRAGLPPAAALAAAQAAVTAQHAVSAANFVCLGAGS
jgi:CHAT domain-containing protein/tetratricopeptide (TPR) repeat protein